MFQLNKNMLLLILVAFSITAFTAPTAMDTKLNDGQEIMIECDLVKKPEKFVVFRKLKTSNPIKSTKSKGVHYRLYIPEGYNKSKTKVYPLMFISSPGGGASLGAMKSRLAKDGWLVACLQESKNGNPDWINNFCAAYDDIVKRCRVAKGLKFATGMSGGARYSSTYALTRPGMRGIFCQAAGFAYGFKKLKYREIYKKYPTHIAVAGSFGTSDSNLYESQDIRCSLPSKSARYIGFFKGGHTWCPENTFGHLMDWMENEVFLRPAPTVKAIKLLTKSAVVEKMNSHSYLWYFDLLVKRLEAAKSKTEKFHILEKIMTVAKFGKLSSVSKITKEFKSLQIMHRKLLGSQEIQKYKQAKTAYKAVQKSYLLFELSKKKGDSGGRKIQLSKKENKLLENFFNSVEKFSNKFPESIFLKFENARVASLRMEYKK
ncbi:MAG: hypothetical protein MJH11_04775 [Lentisphaeria bacterium]|nr:hypothetical protein [Lentisphaeria bacterium]